MLQGIERKRGSSRPRQLLAMVALLGLFAAACGDSGSDNDDASDPDKPDVGREVVEEGAPVHGGQMVIAIGGETNGWNPQYSLWADAGHIVAGSMFEPLAYLNAEGVVEPYLAESITPNDDFSVWTVKLKPDITFHDGSPLNAEAVKVNLEAAKTSPLVGINLGQELDVITVVDELTLEIKLTRPWATYDTSLASQPSMMGAPSMYEQEDLGVENPIGTGPYQFDEWIQDSSLKVNAYDEYWNKTSDAGPPYLDSIEFRIMPDPSARALSLEAGDIDLMITQGSESIRKFRDLSEDYLTVEDNRSEETFVMLNTAVPPFDNKNARLALAHATDRDAISGALGEGITQPVASPFSSEQSPWFVEDDGYVDYDVAKAQEYVDAYKEETGEASLSFKFRGIANVDDVALQQLLVSMWEEVGIDGQVETVEQTAYIVDTAIGKYQAEWFRNFGYQDPTSDFYFWHSDYAMGVCDTCFSINFTQTKNDDLDTAMETVRNNRDFDIRKAALIDAVQALNSEVAYIWIHNTSTALIGDADIRGLNPPRENGFASFDPKPWVGLLWLADG